jgi:hypothetical protein
MDMPDAVLQRIVVAALDRGRLSGERFAALLQWALANRRFASVVAALPVERPDALDVLPDDMIVEIGLRVWSAGTDDDRRAMLLWPRVNRQFARLFLALPPLTRAFNALVHELRVWDATRAFPAAGEAALEACVQAVSPPISGVQRDSFYVRLWHAFVQHVVPAPRGAAFWQRARVIQRDVYQQEPGVDLSHDTDGVLRFMAAGGQRTWDNDATRMERTSDGYGGKPLVREEYGFPPDISTDAVTRTNAAQVARQLMRHHGDTAQPMLPIFEAWAEVDAMACLAFALMLTRLTHDYIKIYDGHDEAYHRPRLTYTFDIARAANRQLCGAATALVVRHKLHVALPGPLLVDFTWRDAMTISDGYMSLYWYWFDHMFFFRVDRDDPWRAAAYAHLIEFARRPPAGQTLRALAELQRDASAWAPPVLAAFADGRLTQA